MWILPVSKIEAFLLNYRLSCFTIADRTKEKNFGPSPVNVFAES